MDSARADEPRSLQCHTSPELKAQAAEFGIPVLDCDGIAEVWVDSVADVGVLYVSWRVRSSDRSGFADSFAVERSGVGSRIRQIYSCRRSSFHSSSDYNSLWM